VGEPRRKQRESVISCFPCPEPSRREGEAATRRRRVLCPTIHRHARRSAALEVARSRIDPLGLLAATVVTDAADHARTRTTRLGRCSRADAGLGPPPTTRARLRVRSARLLVADVSLAGNGAAPLVFRRHAAPQMPLPAPRNARARTAPTPVSPAVGL